MKQRIFIFFLITILAVRLDAQLCTGRLGNPTASKSFGTSANPPALNSHTSYQFNPSGCPGAGEYSLPNLSFNCASGTWHTIVADHTPGDVNGLFMLVNASPTPTQLYIDTVSGLCNGIAYEFSFWVLNMVKPLTCENVTDPNLEYSVQTLSGLVIASGTSGILPQTDNPIWKKVGVYFQPPAGVSSVRFVISNKSSGGCGNSFAMDDIEFAPCGPDVSATIGASGTYYQMCADAQQTIQLNGNYSNGYNDPRFQWQIQSENSAVWNDIPGATSNNYLRPPTASGTYTYRLSVGEGSNINSPSCRVYSNIVTIFVEPNPDAQLTSYVYGCYGGTVILYAAGGSTYSWTGPNGFSSNQQLVSLPNIQFTDAGKYWVRVTTNSGCPGIDSLDLIIYPAANISVSPSNASVCEGIPVNMNATGGLRFVWWPSEGLSNDTIANPIAQPKNTTTYQVRVTNQYGCSDTGSVPITVWKKPIADAGPDKKIRPGLQTQLEGKISGAGADYYWTPTTNMTAVNSLRPVVSPPATTIYTLHANSKEGCGSTIDEVKVVVYDRISIPNVFSPNNDAINDTWFIEPLYLFPECRVDVFNRYGEIVFRSNGYDRPWDGTKNGHPLPTGVYYYVIDLKEKGKLPLNGSVTIIR